MQYPGEGGDELCFIDNTKAHHDPDARQTAHSFNPGLRKQLNTGDTAAHKSKNVNDQNQGLGRWFFDKRHRKRRYIALTGKIYSGAIATQKARIDKQCVRNPHQTARFELQYLMSVTTPAVLIGKLGAVENVGDVDQTARSVSDNAAIALRGEVATQPRLVPALELEQAVLEKGAGLRSLSAWGLPRAVVERYERAKVRELFDWQVDCLTAGGGSVLAGDKNLVYSAPTSGGKTLVSEILILRRIAAFLPTAEAAALQQQQQQSHIHQQSAAAAGAGTGAGVGTGELHTVLFVVPFVALAEEKAAYLQEMWQDMRIGVKAFHGDGGADGSGTELTPDVEVAVCTIERANILLTQLLDEGTENRLKMVVVDEIHLISDAQRGFVLEVLLSKLRFLLPRSVQLVGMSATLPNIADLASWLDAALYVTQYRPVDLQVRLCVGRTLYAVRKHPPHQQQPQSLSSQQPHVSLPPSNPQTEYVVEREYVSSVGQLPGDPDGWQRLCLDTVMAGSSVMLFCDTKRRCEICASSVATAIKDHLHSILFEQKQLQCQQQLRQKQQLVDVHHINSVKPVQNANTVSGAPVAQGGVAGVSESIQAGRLRLLEALSQTPVGLCSVLAETLPAGVAYHHAGLTHDERAVVEEGLPLRLRASTLHHQHACRGGQPPSAQSHHQVRSTPFLSAMFIPLFFSPLISSLQTQLSTIFIDSETTIWY